MKPTPYNDINNFLDLLLNQIRGALADKLVGLYLYGSLVWGDFDFVASDIDLIAATDGDITQEEFTQLNNLQDEVLKNYQEWEQRLEIAYLSTEALRTFKTQNSSIAVRSPGEPFHFKETDSGWLLNFYVVQEKGIALYGPAPQTIITPISKKEYLEVVHKSAEDWREYITHSKSSRPSQAYAILTICRILYSCTNGEQVSKKQAALWTQQQFPEYATLISEALRWRAEWRNTVMDIEETYPETLRFVTFVIDYISENLVR